jgi:spermidine synthase
MPKTEHWQWYVEEFAPTEAHHHALDRTFFAGRTQFQDVAIVSTPVFGKMLIIDGDTQSSQLDERIYHEALVHPALAATGARTALILGGGEGATLREVLRSPAIERAVMVDIDGEVVALSREFLPEWSSGAFDDPRADVIVGDALAYLADGDSTFDVILSDLTEPLEDSPSNPLFNSDVFAGIKRRLAPGGVYALQASTAGPHNCALHAKMARSLRRHYRYVRSFSAYVPAFDTDWAFLACSDGVDVADLEHERIDRHVAGLSGENFFYDAQTHRRLFSLPIYLRRALEKDGDTF